MSLRRMVLITAMAAAGAAGVWADSAEMPITKGQSLSGHQITLPTATEGHLAVLVIGFSHSSQKAMERWDKAIGAQVKAKGDVPLYNISVIQDAPRFIRGVITHGIKAMVPAAGQDHFLTVDQGEDELKKAVDFSGADGAYVVVLGASGKIVFHIHGDPSGITKKEVVDQLKGN